MSNTKLAKVLRRKTHTIKVWKDLTENKPFWSEVVNKRPDGSAGSRLYVGGQHYQMEDALTFAKDAASRIPWKA